MFTSAYHFFLVNSMNNIMAKLQRFGRIRQLHTIISQETIRPSSPTPPHLKTYNLSLLDRFAAHIHIPFVFFYPNFKNANTNILKKSLSKTLTPYYPFSGRFPSPNAHHINCSDEGADFLEASVDTRLQDFIFKKDKDDTIDQIFIPNGQLRSSPNLVEVQLIHFACGGAAVAVFTSHKVADGSTMFNFFNHWATVTRGGSPIDPSFISSSITNTKVPEYVIKNIEKDKYIRKAFVFPNSKLSELKNKVNAMETTSMNPTRVELVTSLIFKCAAGAATTKSCSSKPSTLFHPVNMRSKIIKSCSQTAAGNISTMVMANVRDSDGIKLNGVIGKLRKEIMELEGLRDVQEVAENLLSRLSMLPSDQDTRDYSFSSLCNLPLYESDFGWGKPVDVMLPLPDVNDRSVILMDTPSRDGIKAHVRLEKEEMAIFQKDQELLAYLQDI